MLAPWIAAAQTTTPAPADIGALKDIRVIFHTSKGDIHATLFPSAAPVTVASFVNLVRKKFYDGLTFHRVVPDFVIQGGDPLGTGEGGPGYGFEEEFSPKLRYDKPGAIGMASEGPGTKTNGSQFFITHQAVPRLNDKYTIFGQVTQGQDVVNRIAIGDKILSIDVLDDPYDVLAAEADRIEQWNTVFEAPPRGPSATASPTPTP